MPERCYRYRADHFNGLCANRFVDVSGSGECGICVSPTVTYETGKCGCAPGERVLPRAYKLKVEKSDIFGVMGSAYEFIVGDYNLTSIYFFPTFHPAPGVTVDNGSCDFTMTPVYFEGASLANIYWEGFFQFTVSTRASNIPIVDGVKSVATMVLLRLWGARYVNGIPYPQGRPFDPGVIEPVQVASWATTKSIPACSYDWKFSQTLRAPFSPSVAENFKLTFSN